MKKKSLGTMEFTKDEFGKEILLKDGKLQVMMEWEKPYMQASIDALHPSGNVLEVGFGCGYSAAQIQQYHPKSHMIIELHPIVAEKAREFAKSHPHVTIIEDSWQNALPHLGVFDAVFFNDYPLESDAEINALELKKDQSQQLLQKGNLLIEGIERFLPFIKEIVYSDADLQRFIDDIAAQPGISDQHLIRFLADLERSKQISRAQAEKALGLLLAKGVIKEIPTKKPEENRERAAFRGPNARFYVFLNAVLNKHMRVGSRFSCFLSSAQSKFEDQKFYDEVIVNPNLEYHEEKIPVDVPPNCSYYSGSEALVITITKRA